MLQNTGTHFFDILRACAGTKEFVNKVQDLKF